LNFSRQAFVYNNKTNEIVEFDFIKNAKELTAIIADKKDAHELNHIKMNCIS
jgi:hypothetical protein